MINMIVITGLDGSGKSTFLNQLEVHFDSDSTVFRLPTMDPEKFRTDPVLFECCEMINELGERGDNEGEPGMKIIAMFSSVLLFNDLFHCLSKQNVGVIFCERHPLVDTCIYAKVYHKVMHPSFLSIEKAVEIDEKYNLLLLEILRRLGIETSVSKVPKSHLVLNFLYDWFSDEANFTPQRVFELFEMRKPDEIFFLDAPAEVLFGRIQDRERKEYHENISALKQMRSFYHELLPQFGTSVEIVDATNRIAPDELFERLKRNFFTVD